MNRMKHPTLQWTLGDRIRKARTHAGMSIDDMADYLGVHRNTVGGWERDDRRPKRHILILWAQRCDVSLEWLTTGSGLGEGVSSCYAGFQENSLDRLALAS